MREWNAATIGRNAEEKKIARGEDAVEERKDGGDLVPADVLREVERQEVLELVRGLNERSEVGDFAIPREAYIRTWETLAAGTSNQTLLQQSSEPEVAVFPKFQWQAAYSKVNGDVPGVELSRHRLPNANTDVAYLRFRLEFASSGIRTLKMHRTEGVRLYVDGKLVPTKNIVKLELSQGSHSLMLAVDDIPSGQPIRVSVE